MSGANQQANQSSETKAQPLPTEQPAKANGSDPERYAYFRATRAEYTIYRDKPKEGVTPEGQRFLATPGRRITFKKFHLRLDMQDAEEKKDAEFLMTCGRLGLDYVRLDGEGVTTRKSRADIIAHLMKMDPSAIFSLFSPEEVDAAGLTQNADAAELIAVFLELGKNLPDEVRGK